MSAAEIARALAGRKAGGGWTACCPAHDDRTPSLSIRDTDDGNVLVRCHAGCGQARVIAALRARGLWKTNGPDRLSRHAPNVERRLDQDDRARSQAALAIWQSASPAPGTLVETYLASRGLQLPPAPTLRFHGGLKHPSGGIWPAMVALVAHGSDDKPLAIHRTFLARDGRGKAPLDPQKMMLGPCRGGAVRLTEAGNVLMVGEGIETCLAAALAAGHPCWSALCTSGLRSLILPNNVRDVIVLADGDEPGEAAARDCARRWKREGRRVRIARPPQGLDFNDLYVGHTTRSEGIVMTAFPVELLIDGRGVYGIGLKEAQPKRAVSLMFRRDRLEAACPCTAALQRITGGFRHGMFSNMVEERFRREIHYYLLRNAGLPWPPTEPYWSSDPQQQTRNRQIFHGLRLQSLWIVNGLIGSALEEAADPGALKLARRFPFHARFALYSAAALSSRALQLGHAFPALFYAIYQPSAPIDESARIAAACLVEAGAPLKTIAGVMCVPMALRNVKHGAAKWALHVSDTLEYQQSLVHAYMPDSLPKQKFWLRCVALAGGCGPEFAEWIAKHSATIEGPPQEILSFISDCADWVRACLSASLPAHVIKAVAGNRYSPRGEQFVTRPFSANMSIDTVMRLNSEWHEAVANNISGSSFEFVEPWCSAGESLGYEIVPIKTGDELYREGHALHHCVGTRVADVIRGGAYFYSVRKEDKRLATLELCKSGNGIAIGELRGSCNSQVPKELKRAVTKWVKSQREVRFPKERDPANFKPWLLLDDDIPF